MFLKSAVLQLAMTMLSVLAEDYVLVDIESGTLRGRLRSTYTNRSLYSFEGIPYAEPPLNDLRFQLPVIKSTWDGVRDALSVGSPCPQYINNTVIGNEDCLYLNVYSPQMASQNSSLKTVMVWIHGGCFREGRGDQSAPDYFIDNDIVFVTINYRLGLLGFLSTGDDIIPGNMGLKDQTEALRWVQRNIANFGGDPEKVTIFGESAGGASIHYHILSPLSKGLFQKAVAMSGTALNPWAFSKNATDRAVRFAEHLGHSFKSSEDLVEFFSTVDADTLVQNINSALTPEDSLSLFTCVWAPSVEPEHDGAFLVKEPWVLVADGRYNYVPYLAGVTSLELLAQTQPGGVLSTEEQVCNFSENFDEIVACDLRLPMREDQLSGAQKVREYYFNISDITLKENYTTALFDSHLFFVEGVDTVIRSMALYSSEPVYYYDFAFNGPISQFPGGPGAAHADDTYYLFATTNLDPNSDGATIRDQMTAMWANFAKYGNPTPDQSSLLPLTWGQYNETSQVYLQITAPLGLQTKLFEPYMRFWHSLLP